MTWQSPHLRLSARSPLPCPCVRLCPTVSTQLHVGFGCQAWPLFAQSRVLSTVAGWALSPVLQRWLQSELAIAAAPGGRGKGGGHDLWCIIRQLAEASLTSPNTGPGQMSSPSQPWLTLSIRSHTGSVLTPSQIFFCSAYQQHYYMPFYLRLAKLPDFEALGDDLIQRISWNWHSQSCHRNRLGIYRFCPRCCPISGSCCLYLKWNVFAQRGLENSGQNHVWNEKIQKGKI